MASRDIRMITKNGIEVTENYTLIEIDHETIIEVIGLGTVGARWKVSNNNGGEPGKYDPAKIMAEIFGPSADGGFYEVQRCFGAGSAWVREITFAHMVMDIIDNY